MRVTYGLDPSTRGSSVARSGGFGAGLAILAAAGVGGMSRARVLGVLCPDMDEERASHALSQTLYKLRGDLGRDVVLTGPTLRLDPQQMTSDVGDFRAAVASKQWAEAAALYTGPFLDGFHLAAARAFEEWVAAEREHLALQYRVCLEALALAAERAGQLAEAVEWWHALLRQDPFNSRVATALARSLIASGDRGNALQILERHRAVLCEELDADTGHEKRLLIERARTDADSR